MNETYPARYERLEADLGSLSKQLAGPMAAFTQLHRSAMVDGALTNKVKELMALAIAITVRCDGCIAYHVRDALKAGASRPEVLETVGVAVLMGGGPSVVYGSQAVTALGEFETAPASSVARMVAQGGTS
jgi:AhpD family alkylhydroperoxidase